MPTLRQFFTFLLSFATGIGLLLALPHLPFTAKAEHAFFLHPERFQKETFYSDHGDRKDLTLQTYQLGGTDQVPIASFAIDQKTREIFGTDQPGPAQWAYLLHTIRAKNCDLLAITAPLSWPNADEIPLRALQHEVSQFPPFALGLVGKNTGLASTLPPYLKNSVIPGDFNHFKQLPEIDQIEQPPSITAAVFGIAAIEGQIPEKDGNTAFIPMLVRWDQDLIPSLQLAALIASHNITAADVIIDPSGYLRLGKQGTVLALDTAGRVKLPITRRSTPSALSLLTTTRQSQRSLILHDQDPPLIASNLEPHHYALWPRKPTLQKTYQRWPLAIEIGALFLITLLIQRNKFLLTTIVSVTALAFSVTLSQWLPVLPFIVVFLTSLLLSARANQGKTSP